MSAEPACALRVAKGTADGATVLTVEGVLDSETYRTLRDEIIQAALDEPAAVIVEVSELCIPFTSALAVFTSARWLIGHWPDVPIMLVCGQQAGRSALTRNGVVRYIPVHPSTKTAVAALSSYPQRHRRRARAALPATTDSLRHSRELVEEWLTAWAKPDLVAVAKVIVTTFVENVLQHTDAAPNLRLECSGDTVTVAVEDDSRAPPTLSEMRMATGTPTGLRILGALCRVWGNAPTPSDKNFWAVIGPENQL